MEDLLTESEIDEILRDLKKEEYLNDKILHLGRNKTSIILHSNESGLILVRGNEDTGYEHIFNRHSLFSRIPFKDDPSKIRLEMALIKWLTVLSKIFKRENFNPEKNQFPEKYDLYQGEYEHFDNKKIKYRLITYKNTGIIHTFYIITNSKPFNPKRILNLRKGWVKSIENIKEGIQTHYFSYYDNSNDKEIAKVFVECDLFKQTEKWRVEIYNNSGNLVYDEMVKENKYSKQSTFDKMDWLNFGDTVWIEKEIKQILNQ